MSDLFNPVTKIAELSDAFPILLFPLRLETRFKAIGSAHELWLRVFPDDCNIYHKEEQLSESELRNAKSFWTEIWKAGGDQTQERGAWKSLVTSHGAGRAGWIIEHYKPLNPQPADLRFPDDAAVPTSPTSWTKAPKAVALPDRFVAVGYNGSAKQIYLFDQNVSDNLSVGPDPSLPADKQIKKDGNGDLIINEDLQWMVDFEKAIEAGMGVKIPMNIAGAAIGFDKLFVVGVRYSTDPVKSQALLEKLVSDHFEGRGGFELLRQGTPTNNTDDEASGVSSVEDPDESYERIFKKSSEFDESDNFQTQSDGQKLADLLGINPDILKKVPHANGSDQLEANAMNTALFPATLGYFMEEMMSPLFTDDLVNRTKTFFADYVSGRGPVPAIRIGKQPYGILPVTAYSKLKFPAPNPGRVLVPRKSPQTIFLNKLHRLLMEMNSSWTGLVPEVSRISRSNADPQQTLLNVLGLHPNSVEFHQRYSQSVKQLYNQLVLQRDVRFAATIDLALDEIGKNIASAVDRENLFDIGSLPISKKYFLDGANLLGGPLVDDLPMSESEPVRPYTADGKKNYLEWLATSGAEIIRTQDFGGSTAPNAILYLLLRHALMLAQADAAARLIITKDPGRKLSEFFDPDFIGVQQEGGRSKFESLYAVNSKITGNDTQKLVEYIYKPEILDKSAETKRLKDTIGAIGILANTPTARLERLLVEHLDCCNYRIDAWLTGLTNYKLSEQRKIGQPEKKNSKGIFLGAYGWLIDVRPNPKALTDIQLSPELDRVLNRGAGKPMHTDANNLGYIHAPSLNQATAAAVLRSAYESNKHSGEGNPFAVNLTSDRVRIASQFLEGIRNGQSLAALLGYQFERGLHDRAGQIELDSYIYPLRKAFPLVADNLKDTLSDPAESIATVQANHVVDGLKLVAQIQKSGTGTFPFGLPPFAGLNENSPQAAAINAEAARILDITDAISDLVVAEQAYQMVQGNFDKAAGVADAFSKGSYPPEIDIVQTPRSGVTLTQKIAVQFNTDADPAVSPSSIAMTPRAKAEPGINQWLAGILPPPEKVLCQVDYTKPGAVLASAEVSQADLGLQPIDLLYLLNLDSEQFMTELDDRISDFVRYQISEHPQTAIKINYTRPIDPADKSKVSFFELAALVKSLRQILIGSKPLDQNTFTLPGSGQQVAAVMDDVQFKNRILALRGEFGTLKTEIDSLLAAHSDASIDILIQKASALLLKLALYENSQTGTGFMQQAVSDDPEAEQKRLVSLREDIKTALENILKSVTDKLVTSADLIQKADAAVINADKISLLQGAFKKLLGEDALVLPHFQLPEEEGNAFENSFTNSNQLLAFTTTHENRFFPVDDWLAGVSRVREKVWQWENLTLLSAAFKPGNAIELTPLQFPFRENDRWAAMKFRNEKDEADTFAIDSDTLLYTTHFAQPFDKTKTQCGIVFDEWTEVIPSKEQNTGIAFHYDQPNSEPPQTMLLVTPPDFSGNWQWDNLVAALEETLEMAKKRAVEPAMLEKTKYAQFLPTTMMAVTLHWITVSTNLALNNNVYQRIEDN
jgi:hypothetical protein